MVWRLLKQQTIVDRKNEQVLIETPISYEYLKNWKILKRRGAIICEKKPKPPTQPYFSFNHRELPYSLELDNSGLSRVVIGFDEIPITETPLAGTFLDNLEKTTFIPVLNSRRFPNPNLEDINILLEQALKRFPKLAKEISTYQIKEREKYDSSEELKEQIKQDWLEFQIMLNQQFYESFCKFLAEHNSFSLKERNSLIRKAKPLKTFFN